MDVGGVVEEQPSPVSDPTPSPPGPILLHPAEGLSEHHPGGHFSVPHFTWLTDIPAQSHLWRDREAMRARARPSCEGSHLRAWSSCEGVAVFCSMSGGLVDDEVDLMAANRHAAARYVGHVGSSLKPVWLGRRSFVKMQTTSAHRRLRNTSQYE